MIQNIDFIDISQVKQIDQTEWSHTQITNVIFALSNHLLYSIIQIASLLRSKFIFAYPFIYELVQSL